MIDKYGNKDKAKKSKFDLLIESFQKFWWIYTLCLIGFSVSALFIMSFVYDKSITISVMNSWVGIVLGLVATIIGIISMFLSFYNLDQSIKTQQETLEKINGIKEDIIKYIEVTSKETQQVIKESTEKDTIQDFKEVSQSNFASIRLKKINKND